MIITPQSTPRDPQIDSDRTTPDGPRASGPEPATSVTPDAIQRVGSTNAAALSDHRDSGISDVAGPVDHYGANWRVSWMSELGDGALMWLALSELAQSGIRDMQAAKQAKAAFQANKVNEKKNQTHTTEKRQAAERDESVRNFATSVGTAVIVATVSAVGAGIAKNATDQADEVAKAAKAGDATQKAAKSAARAAEAADKMAQSVITAGNQAGQVHTAYQNMQSKLDGPARDADERRLEEMRWEQQAEASEQLVEESRSAHEGARELFKLALQILTEHYERTSQATQTYTRA